MVVLAVSLKDLVQELHLAFQVNLVSKYLHDTPPVMPNLKILPHVQSKFSGPLDLILQIFVLFVLIDYVDLIDIS